MPRTAATLGGLVLVAFSVGFNTVRYPIVGQMVGPSPAVAGPDESAQPVDRPPVGSPAESAPLPPPAAGPAEVKPVPDVVETASVDAVRPPEAKPPPADASIAAENLAGAAMKPQKPLVPVLGMPPAGGSASDVDPAATVRRLPPIDPGPPHAAGSSGPQTPDGVIPIYPSTGIE